MKVIVYNRFSYLKNAKKLIAIYNVSDIYNYFFVFVKNGKIHNEKYYAINNSFFGFEFYFKNKSYGRNDDFTIESWKKKVKELKQEERLKIFK